MALFQHFQQYEDTLLIEQVRDNPPLYNTELADYKDGALKEHIWEGVAKVVNKTSADCKKRWKYLRDSYNRCKRKNKTKTGFAALKATKWCYFELLRFLDKDSETEETQDTLEITIKTDTSLDENGQPADGNDAFEFCMVNDEDTAIEKREESSPDIDAPRSSRAGRKRKREADEISDYNQPLANYVQDKDKRNSAKMKTNEPRGDEIDSFCTYIRDILKKLDPALRVDAKSKIFNIMAQYELKNLSFD